MIIKASLAKDTGDGVLQYIYPRSSADIVEYNDSESVKDKLDSLTDQVNAIDVDGKLTNYYTKEQISDLVYTPIHLLGVSVSPDIVEAGSLVSTTVYWQASRTPASMNVDGINVTPPCMSGSKVFTNITSDRTFSVSVTDAGSTNNNPYTSTKSATIRFFNGIYFGAAAEPSAYDSAFVLTLPTKRLQPTPAGSFTVNAGSNQYIYFACPANFTPVFNVNGFSGGFIAAATINFVNAYGNTMAYTIYRSVNAGLGNTTVTVFA